MSRERPSKVVLSALWYLWEKLRRPPPRLTILYYHGVPADQAANFEAHMAYLARTAKVVPADYKGPLDPRRPTVAVTFDDAFRSVRTRALPSLIRHRIPATIFAPSGWLGKAPGWPMEAAGDAEEVVMSAEELLGLPSDLIEIGSHSVSHPKLPQISDAEVTTELAQSRADLAKVMGKTVDTIAFPHGEHDERVLRIAQETGYRHVYGVVPETIEQGADRLLRGRTPVYPTDPLWLFAIKTQGACDWIPAASRMKRALMGRR